MHIAGQGRMWVICTSRMEELACKGAGRKRPTLMFYCKKVCENRFYAGKQVMALNWCAFIECFENKVVSNMVWYCKFRLNSDTRG